MKLLRRPSLILSQDNNHLKSAADDDISVSSEHSTFSVTNATKVDGPIHLPFLKPRQGQVHFDESKNVYHDNAVMTKDECQDLWHSSVDMKNFKAQTHGIAREIYRAETSNTTPNSYARVLVATYDACCRTIGESNDSPLNRNEQKNLRKWMQVAVSRTGLDRVCVREIAQDRSNRRRNVVHVVLDVQESLIFREDIDELIRKASETISRPSRLFAQVVAQAQAPATSM